jgi:hypothetical protein
MFPSHQGLILPLWVRYPRRFEAVALCVGATMPDLVDFAAWPFRGELGHWMGHSLFGLMLACIPVGIALTWLARRYTPRSLRSRLEDPRAPAPTVGGDVLSVGIGALSHIVFDLVSHVSFLLLWPFYVRNDVLPDWWTQAWTTVSLPIYQKAYPIGLHAIAWIVLSGAGIYLFLRSLRKPGDAAEASLPG